MSSVVGRRGGLVDDARGRTARWLRTAARRSRAGVAHGSLAGRRRRRPDAAAGRGRGAPTGRRRRAAAARLPPPYAEPPLALGARDLGGGVAQRRADLVDLELEDGALLALAGLVRTRCLSRPWTMTRMPRCSDSATFSAACRHTEQGRNSASPSFHSLVCRSKVRGVEAIRKLATAAPDGVKRSSGSSTRLPMTVIGVSPAMSGLLVSSRVRLIVAVAPTGATGIHKDVSGRRDA